MMIRSVIFMKKKFKDILEKEPKKKRKVKGFYFGRSEILINNIDKEEKLFEDLKKLRNDNGGSGKWQK
jgi:hypothetical protein